MVAAREQVCPSDADVVDGWLNRCDGIRLKSAIFPHRNLNFRLRFCELAKRVCPYAELTEDTILNSAPHQPGSLRIRPKRRARSL